MGILPLIKYEIPHATLSYSKSEPYLAKVVANDRLTPQDYNLEIRNIVFDISDSGIEYLEGQSIGIIPPSTDTPHEPRYYSIASSRTGEFGCNKTLTICVKRVVFTNEQGQEVRGISSNYLCDLKVGDTTALIGPSGRSFLLPQDDTVNIIMVAAGTGIAPFRAFIQRIFRDKKQWHGKVRLFFGVRNGLESIYMNEENADIEQYFVPQTFEAFKAFSSGDMGVRKQYVQDQIKANQEEICQLLYEGNFAFYLCGMRAMEQGVEKVFREHAEQNGHDWELLKARFVLEGRWNIETY